MSSERTSVGLRLAAVARFLWLQLGVTLLVLLAFESLARLYLHFTERPYVDPRAVADGYHGALWTREYFSEYGEQAAQWHPYTYWVGAPYRGLYINIGDDGARATWRPAGSSRCQHPARIFMFGGSAMWGEGARDDYTLASWLERMLDSAGYCVEVTNLGQNGYVSAQEVLLLADRLREDDVPDLAIFYDGYNDAHSARDAGIAGVTYNESTRSEEFNSRNPFEPSRHGLRFKIVASQLIARSGLGRVAIRLVGALAPRSYKVVRGVLVRRDRGTGEARDKADLEKAVMRGYLANLSIVRALADKFGFRVLFYLQPIISSKQTLTPYERIQESDHFVGAQSFVSTVYRRIAAAAKPDGLHDLSGVFRDLRPPYFIDEVHTTEDGYRIVADHMLPDVRRLLAQMQPGRHKGR